MRNQTIEEYGAHCVGNAYFALEANRKCEVQQSLSCQTHFRFPCNESVRSDP